MIHISTNEIPDYPYQRAVKRPIPIRCYQMQDDFVVETLEGKLSGKKGDYLMVGVRGEMYPCSREIFEQSYDIVQAKEI